MDTWAVVYAPDLLLCELQGDFPPGPVAADATPQHRIADSLRSLGTGAGGDAHRSVEPRNRTEGAGRTVRHSTAARAKLVGCADVALRIAMAIRAALTGAEARPGAEFGPHDADESVGTRARPAAAIPSTRRPIAGGHARQWKRRSAIAAAGSVHRAWQRRSRCDCRAPESQQTLEDLAPAAAGCHGAHE
jgi:hypothetical protein